jgi:two-component sensor histidine kinase
MPDRLLAQDIVAASREPLLILDEQLIVRAASRSFSSTIKGGGDAVVGLPLFRIANGAWNIPELTEQLRRVAAGEAPLEDFEVQQDTDSGPRAYLLHAGPLGNETGPRRLLALTLEDVTERRRIEADCAEAIARGNAMLAELNHRVMNSLAMIGAIFSMEARLQPDNRCRDAFNRMQTRIASIGHLYRNLGRDHAPEAVRSDEYLKSIVDGLITSLSDPSCKVETSLAVDEMLLPTRLAVPVGLLVNEIITNSLKHAFAGRSHGSISVEFAAAGDHHVLRISDNGRGMEPGAQRSNGLGQRLSETFARQLRGTIEYCGGSEGTTVVLKFPRSGTP